MGERVDLHKTLVDMLGNRNVYFQPPSSISMNYPCIIYSLGGYDTKYANNFLYKKLKRYTVIYVDKNPDSLIPDKLLTMTYTTFDRFYVADNLNHYVFGVYY